MKIISLLSFIIFGAILSGCKSERPTAVNANTLSSEMVLVEGGTFQMGSENGYPDERPVHSVTLSSFYIDKYEVTYEKWTEVRAWGLSHGYTDLIAGQNGFDPNGTPYDPDSAEWTQVRLWGMKVRYSELFESAFRRFNPDKRWGGKNVIKMLVGMSTHKTIFLIYPYQRWGYNPQSQNNPVTMVNWSDDVKWCNARSEKEGLTPVYYADSTHRTIYRTGHMEGIRLGAAWDANGYRLPTVAEWEFAAGGGVKSRHHLFSGSDIIGDVAWYVDNSGGKTHPVGLKQSNELGIYDMTGNVWEIVETEDGGDYPSSAQSDPRPTTVGYGGVRGGACVFEPFRSRNTFRGIGNRRRQWNGIRCVKAASTN